VDICMTGMAVGGVDIGRHKSRRNDPVLNEQPLSTTPVGLAQAFPVRGRGDLAGMSRFPSEDHPDIHPSVIRPFGPSRGGLRPVGYSRSRASSVDAQA
jgi:hypothetical protein